MLKVAFCFVLCVLLSGCCMTIHENEYGRYVKGVGLDATFYPVFAIRFGVFEYQLFFNKEQE